MGSRGGPAPGVRGSEAGGPWARGEGLGAVGSQGGPALGVRGSRAGGGWGLAGWGLAGRAPAGRTHAGGSRGGRGLGGRGLAGRTRTGGSRVPGGGDLRACGFEGWGLAGRDAGWIPPTSLNSALVTGSPSLKSQLSASA